MRKIWLVLAVILPVILCTISTGSAAESSLPFRVGVLYWSMNIPGQVAMRKGLEERAASLNNQAIALNPSDRACLSGCGRRRRGHFKADRTDERAAGHECRSDNRSANRQCGAARIACSRPISRAYRWWPTIKYIHPGRLTAFELQTIIRPAG